jgi:hypothetical protein
MVCLFAVSVHAQQRQNLLDAVESGKWRPNGQSSVYDPSNIQSLASDLTASLKPYAVKGVTVQTLENGNARIRATLFEMADPSAAYGYFTLRRAAEKGEPTPVLVGAESFQNASRLYFWQSNYVVKLDGAVDASRDLAGLLSEKILGRSRKPPVSNHLPPRNLLAGSDKYILDPANIDRSFELAGANLGFDDDAEAATASYHVDGHPARLLLLLYPTQQLAKKYAEQLDAAKPALAGFTKRVGPLVAIVSGLTDASAARSILDDVNYETKVTWNKPKPRVGIAEVILTAFTFIGIALAFTVVAGISFGGVRIFVKSRYPNRLFDRPEDMQIIQLNLDQGVTSREIGTTAGAASRHLQ